ncbi:MAG: transcriptional regulator, tetR family [Mycobacterium sp.]|nr:transcriptional regulator, tetR family [Mycobacterium sp.]
MPPDSSATKDQLLDSAAKAFARDGVFNASLIDITRQAGQRNRAALRYHFGSRDGILCAVIDRHADFLARRESDLLAVARREEGLAPVVEALVRPAAELADSGWRGRCCLLIIAELTGEDSAQFGEELQAVLARTGGNDVFALLVERTGEITDALRTERFSLMVMFILRAIADRARLLERRSRDGRPQLGHEPFVQNLVAMATAAMTAPTPLT